MSSLWGKIRCYGFDFHRPEEQAVSTTIFGFRFECACGKYYWFEDTSQTLRKFRAKSVKGPGR